MNPLYNLLNGGNQAPNNPFTNMMNFMNRFNQFRQMFNGNAQQQVQQMLNSGQITQEQYNQAAQMANQIQQMFSGRFQ